MNKSIALDVGESEPLLHSQCAAFAVCANKAWAFGEGGESETPNKWIMHHNYVSAILLADILIKSSPLRPPPSVWMRSLVSSFLGVVHILCVCVFFLCAATNSLVFDEFFRRLLFLLGAIWLSTVALLAWCAHEKLPATLRHMRPRRVRYGHTHADKINSKLHLEEIEINIQSTRSTICVYFVCASFLKCPLTMQMHKGNDWNMEFLIISALLHFPLINIAYIYSVRKSRQRCFAFSAPAICLRWCLPPPPPFTPNNANYQGHTNWPAEVASDGPIRRRAGRYSTWRRVQMSLPACNRASATLDCVPARLCASNIQRVALDSSVSCLMAAPKFEQTRKTIWCLLSQHGSI